MRHTGRRIDVILHFFRPFWNYIYVTSLSKCFFLLPFLVSNLNGTFVSLRISSQISSRFISILSLIVKLNIPHRKREKIERNRSHVKDKKRHSLNSLFLFMSPLKSRQDNSLVRLQTCQIYCTLVTGLNRLPWNCLSELSSTLIKVMLSQFCCWMLSATCEWCWNEWKTCVACLRQISQPHIFYPIWILYPILTVI